MAAPTLTSVSPSVVPSNGGYPIVLTGTFELEMPYRVHVGPNGDTSDPVCFAGAGLGNDAVSPDGTTLSVNTPEMVSGTGNDVYVQERDTPSNNDTLADGVLAIDRDYSTSLWSMKALFAPNRRMGPRSMAMLPAAARPTNYIRESEDLLDALWTANAISQIVSGITDPMGGNRGVILKEDATAAFLHNLEQATPSATPAGLHTISIYAKDDNRDLFMLSALGVGQTFNLATGELGAYVQESGNTLVAASIQAVDHLGETGWYRCSLTMRQAAQGTTDFMISLMETDDLAGLTFDGLDQNSILVALPVMDNWSTVRIHRPTTTEVVT